MANRLETLIEIACNPKRTKADQSTNIAICQLINEKEGIYPRKAAMLLAGFAASSQPNRALLALDLLDTCAKQCGYPFHLQIATKEFLNKIVSKFPERPPPGYSPSSHQENNQWNHFDNFVQSVTFSVPIMDRTLYLIKEWKVGLADMSRFKQDFSMIKEMYRLLRYKGYRFPEIREESIRALVPPEELRTADELEEEDRLARSAKLQELIRRGTPQDLVEAHNLIQIMTGYDKRHQTDYKQKFADEINAIQEQAMSLFEILNAVQPNQGFQLSTPAKNLVQACTLAQARVSKFIQNGDREDSDDLLALNDLLNNVLAKYTDLKQGLYNTHYGIHGRIKESDIPTEQQPPISLIDLDDDDECTTEAPPEYTFSHVNDLADIFEKTNIVSPSSNSPKSFGSPVVSDLTQSTPGTEPKPTGTSGEQIVLVNKNGLCIVLEITQVGSLLSINALYSNRSNAPMTRMTLSLATPKSVELNMGFQSSQTVPPKSENQVYQTIQVKNTTKDSLRLRYKATYEQSGVEMELSGEYSAYNK
ncbi:hypothetical protein PHYBLDRAFT_180223 [Phycomyces blakesleeanus NRRL 1555(-)]|uniref:VHS domain-containing protein n=2 Tax=Phycomyces blakesleeanus TaxID=4837 RepID=A0A162UKA3_PHYB8|nr:hypothetical protein PHYBLDRAFT_180223 [Phycomyces blakesleeanus NRRL 1555(-)]OAD76782.1 hypothetical protein PHYBLDRAFT_180223 [Phycomyces blakesleeanus NRRL 1555(-)]|eukprot:XP_018294822.1 hypothetical protein PHYBLDRAFT_180223 [Phycomyces blakesleeanus NRRL 1555(-)]